MLIFLTITLKALILDLMRNEYPGFLTPKSKPLDPVRFARQTEGIIGSGDARKHTNFYCVGVYGGISTGYTVGCCLKCIFCWVDLSRDFPQREGEFFYPQKDFNRLVHNAKKRGFKKLRISGGEPTLCPEHLLSILDLTQKTNMLFILETNGILLGAESYPSSKVSSR